mmetsp:Transcript_26648/g.39586  ORF Transcript_26648/g.39586 Transcript_26648/m.39586 type:complete len:307 (+) Transcript_26648:51-971(+)|eukprot:CAMPEP_0185021324 /NCGR_PEP_ID=MMETSP1103-20130426/4011_1 /TAXON_ID=36769 /ORGANISM="Paraphysomonas bandaiensis, Strain Caron Lab Isolate" /LENGTH=306 /DNA_ID=CAMNT_0027552779 /DNA_START=51 /DNA_END=971 /DNA_ORIENTATION=-
MIVKFALALPELAFKLAGFLSISVYDHMRVLLSSPKSLQGEICLITGGGSGIGRGIAIELAKLGAIVVLWDINIQGAEDTAAMIRRTGGHAATYKVDVTNKDEVYAVADRVRSEVGEVTVLINNAGIVSGKKIFDPENNDAYMVKTMEVNTISHFWTVKAFLPSMIERNHGHLVTVASSAGMIGVNGLADYCASKFGAIGFHESVAAELHTMKKFGVKTTLVNPFFINTGMFDGVKSSNDLFLPVLEPAYVVKRVIQGIRKNNTVVYMPWLVSTMYFLKCFPYSAQMYLADYFEIGRSMDHFKGRK